jgi:hypothetical protein
LVRLGTELNVRKVQLGHDRDGKIIETTCRVEFTYVAALNVGSYFLNAGVMGSTNGEDGYLHRLIDVVMFRVIPDKPRLVTVIIVFSCVPKIKEMVINEG